MDSRELIEKGIVSEESKVEDSGVQPDAVTLVEMGDASVETKGIAHGLEYNLTPRYF